MIGDKWDIQGLGRAGNVWHVSYTGDTLDYNTQYFKS
jgi:hypothetical protein